MKRPVALIIMDGFGCNPDKKGNAIAEANTPNLDKIFAECPTTQIGASGLDVGLPDGQMGNSEVGHTNIGAGRVVYQMLVKISKDIKDGVIRKNPAICGAMDNCVKNGKALHFIGLLSDGGVHSHIEHLIGLIEMAKDMGVEKIYVHALLDGRDVPPTSGADYMQELVDAMERIGAGKVATVMGRFYATMPGTASRRPTPRWSTAKASRAAARSTPSKSPMRKGSPTSSWSPPSSTRTA